MLEILLNLEGGIQLKGFAENAFDIVNNSPEAFTARVRKDSDVMSDLVKRRVIAAE